MKIKLIKKPTSDAVTLAEVKAHLRLTVTDTTHDARLAPYLAAAIAKAESEAGRALITQTWDVIFASWYELGSTILPFGQLQSVTSLKYFDSDGVEQTVSTDDYTVVGLKTEAAAEGEEADRTDEGRIIYEEAPALREYDPITVRIVCGYGDDSTKVDKIAKAAILFMVEEMDTGVDLEKAVDRLINLNRLWS